MFKKLYLVLAIMVLLASALQLRILKLVRTHAVEILY